MAINPITSTTEGGAQFDQFFYQQPNNLYHKQNRNSNLHIKKIGLVKLGEAGFTSAYEKLPIIANMTHPLVVTMGGFDSTNKIAFIASFIFPKDVEFYKDFFVRTYTEMAKEPRVNPIQIHLMSGVNEISKSTVVFIKRWLGECEIPMQIVSECDLPNYTEETGFTIDSRSGTTSRNLNHKKASTLNRNNQFPIVCLKKMSYGEDFLPQLVEIPLQIDYEMKFKDFPVAFEDLVPFTVENKEESLERIASFVSKIYATFLDLEDSGRKELRKKGIYSSLYRGELASRAQCELFEDTLKSKIIEELTIKGEIALSTDLTAYKTLKEVFDQVFNKTINTSYLIPFTTLTTISIRDTTYVLNMHLGHSDEL
ncbi:MAG: hypothetical protein H0X29_02395 [Parachlamydiaceae bacterium]|nr:hypothetical protein [Parachlamydiaceae bacterium]